MTQHQLPQRLLLIAGAALAFGAAGGALAQQARGVNPAEIDSRFDLIVKNVRLEPEGHSRSLTLKYDHRLGDRWGLNFELPAHTRLAQPGLERTGNGDLFARARWIVPAGTWTYGASFETVLPVASRDELGTGRFQLNVSGLLVRAFSPGFIAAAAVKQTQSVGGDDARAHFRNTDVRLVPVFIMPDGWAVTGEIRHTWEHETDLQWQRLDVTLNKQFDAHWAGSLSTGRDYGDRRDRGSVALALKYFF